MPKKRIAVIDRELCRPKVCGYYLCRKVCPVNRSGEECVSVSETDKKPLIDESKCITCGICMKKCPTNAISVVNLPGELDERPVHRHGPNMFALYRLPLPKPSSVVALIGPNGVGKSTVINILAGEIKPNGGDFGETNWENISSMFKGSELQSYFQKLSEKKISIAHKPQNVDTIPNVYKGKVGKFLKNVDENGRLDEVLSDLRIEEMINKDIKTLSGGELQLLAVAATLLKDREFYFFDEPSSYLDIFSRLIVANEIRKLAEKAVVMVVEHDMALSDYLADSVHILYGKPSVFGIVSKPYGVRVGINAYLEGYIKEDNVRFRKEGIVFSRRAKPVRKSSAFLGFPGFSKSFKDFSLTTQPGTLHSGEVIGILGANSIGKTTFIRMLAGDLKPDKGKPLPKMNLSYKSQRIVLKEDETDMSVMEFLESGRKLSREGKRIAGFLGLEKLFDRKMKTLSGGELQSAFIALNLMKDSDLVLMDEPSAFLDVEQRLRVAKLIRTMAEEKEIPFFVVDHDLLFIDVISDRVMLFSGEPGVKGRGSAPQNLKDGMNQFLKAIGITYRRDPVTGRPRINKPGSRKDREQKEKNQYYYAD
jgi:ATP-binding cassette subfamily E protein 1